MVTLANEKNLNLIKSGEEAREKGRKGGKASGKVRREKANFRKTLNALLTAQIEVDSIKDFLEANGVDSSYESAINFAMIQKALKGDVKAYIAIRDTLGTKTKLDEKEQKQRIKMMKAQEKKLKEKNEKEGEAMNITFIKANEEKDEI